MRHGGGNSRDMEELVNLAESLGCRVRKTGKNKWFIYPPDKNIPPKQFAATASDHRAYKNNLAWLRRTFPDADI